jgi:hypothetical protein
MSGSRVSTAGSARIAPDRIFAGILLLGFRGLHRFPVAVARAIVPDLVSWPAPGRARNFPGEFRNAGALSLCRGR